jgi:hypothetical protein
VFFILYLEYWKKQSQDQPSKTNNSDRILKIMANNTRRFASALSLGFFVLGYAAPVFAGDVHQNIEQDTRQVEVQQQQVDEPVQDQEPHVEVPTEHPPETQVEHPQEPQQEVHPEEGHGHGEPEVPQERHETPQPSPAPQPQPNNEQGQGQQQSSQNNNQSQSSSSSASQSGVGFDSEIEVNPEQKTDVNLHNQNHINNTSTSQGGRGGDSQVEVKTGANSQKVETGATTQVVKTGENRQDTKVNTGATTVRTGATRSNSQGNSTSINNGQKSTYIQRSATQAPGLYGNGNNGNSVIRLRTNVCGNPLSDIEAIAGNEQDGKSGALNFMALGISGASSTSRVVIHKKQDGFYRQIPVIVAVNTATSINPYVSKGTAESVASILARLGMDSTTPEQVAERDMVANSLKQMSFTNLPCPGTLNEHKARINDSFNNFRELREYQERLRQEKIKKNTCVKTRTNNCGNLF